MITETQKEAICNTLGKQYSPMIIAYLKVKRIKPLKSKSFTPKIIQDIVNGHQEHIAVEKQIINLLETIKKQSEEINQQYETLL